MPERSGRRLLFCLHAMLAVFLLIAAIAIAIEMAAGGYGIGLLIVSAMADGVGVVFFVFVAMLSGATAMHLRP